MFSATDWTPGIQAVWLSLLQTELQAAAPVGLGPTAAVYDDSYVLCRVVIVLASRLARWDVSIAELLSGVLDVETGMGAALEVMGYRRGVKRLNAVSSEVKGVVQGVPGKQVAGVLVKDPNGVQWLLSDGIIPVNGILLDVVAVAVDPGPVVGPTFFTSSSYEYLPSSQTSGVVKFSALEVLRIGRVVEPAEDYRARVAAARSVRGATEPAIEKRLREVPGVEAATAFVNRGSAPKDGIPGHHVAAILRGGAALDIALCLRDIACSATAGFHGLQAVTLPHPQGSQVGTTTVRFTYSVSLRGFIRLTIKTSDAPVKLNPTDTSLLIRQIYGLMDAWTQTLGEGVVPLSSELEAYVKDRLPKGIITTMSAVFSRVQAGPFANIIEIARHESFRCTSQPVKAIHIGNKGEPFNLPGPGNVDFSYLGGATQTVNFTGAEIALSQILGVFAAGGLTGIEVVTSTINTLQVQSLEAGLLVNFEILGTSDAPTVFALGWTLGTYQGAFRDTVVINT